MSAPHPAVLDYPWTTPPAPGEAVAVAPGIRWIRMPLPFALKWINLWLLEDGEGWTIIDTGVAMEQSREYWRAIFEATLGGKVKVPTVGGAVMLNVPAGSNTGTSLRLKGRGLLDRKSGQRGDQYVKLKIVMPETPDPALKEFLEKWEAGKAYDPRQSMEQFT